MIPPFDLDLGFIDRRVGDGHAAQLWRRRLLGVGAGRESHGADAAESQEGRA